MSQPVRIPGQGSFSPKSETPGTARFLLKLTGKRSCIDPGVEADPFDHVEWSHVPQVAHCPAVHLPPAPGQNGPEPSEAPLDLNHAELRCKACHS